MIAIFQMENYNEFQNMLRKMIGDFAYKNMLLNSESVNVVPAFLPQPLCLFLGLSFERKLWKFGARLIFLLLISTKFWGTARINIMLINYEIDQ